MAIDYEISKIKDYDKKRNIKNLYNALELKEIFYSKEIEKRAIELLKYNIKVMDAVHLAYAESKEIDYFITTDRLLINASNRVCFNFRIINPIEFVMGGECYDIERN